MNLYIFNYVAGWRRCSAGESAQAALSHWIALIIVLGGVIATILAVKAISKSRRNAKIKLILQLMAALGILTFALVVALGEMVGVEPPCV